MFLSPLSHLGEVNVWFLRKGSFGQSFDRINKNVRLASSNSLSSVTFKKQLVVVSEKFRAKLGTGWSKTCLRDNSLKDMQFLLYHQ